MEALYLALTSRAGALAAWEVTVSLAIALSVFAVQRAELRRLNVQFANTVGQLKGSLEFQNLQVGVEGEKTLTAQKAARAAIDAARAAHAGDDAQIAAIAALPVETDLAAACKAADDAIMEFIK